MKKYTHGRYIAWAVGFIVFVVLILVFSAAWRFVGLVRKSTFDAKQQFIIAATNPESSYIVVLNPDRHTAVLVTITGKLEGTMHDVIPVPEDAVSFVTISTKDDPTGILQKIAKHITSPQTTDIDKMRIGQFVTSLSSDSITSVIIHLPEDKDNLTKILSREITDKVLYQEGKTITIINASGEVGLGSKLSLKLTTVGANVIAVRTADTIQDISTIQYEGDSSYTLHRLERITGIMHVMKQTSQAVSDITIIIGKDMIQNF